jgi:hypothetical protein
MQWCDYTFVQIIQNDSHRPTNLTILICNCSVALNK